MNMTEEREKDLINNAILGVKDAESELYNKYVGVVRNYINKKFPNNNDIDDDVSEIMIKIFRNLKTYQHKKSKFISWVYVITKNHMIDKWRCNSNTFELSSNSSISFEYDDHTEQFYTQSTLYNNNIYTTTSTHDIENDSTINFISTQISSTDYTMLNMKYIEGYNYDEIGREFNVTSSTASNRVNYIKTKLKNTYHDLFDTNTH